MYSLVQGGGEDGRSVQTRGICLHGGGCPSEEESCLNVRGWYSGRGVFKEGGELEVQLEESGLGRGDRGYRAGPEGGEGCMVGIRLPCGPKSSLFFLTFPEPVGRPTCIAWPRGGFADVP